MSNKVIVLVLMVVMSFVPLAIASGQESEKVEALVKPYQVSPELDNVVNLSQFGSFTPAQKELLAKNGFVVTTSDNVQLYHIYENNDYLQIPSFITTDLMLQVYHVFFDYTLRTVESEKLYPIAVDLTEKMLMESVEIYKEATNPEVKEASLKNIAFFGVGLKLLTVEEETLKIIKAEAEEEHYRSRIWYEALDTLRNEEYFLVGLRPKLPVVSSLHLSLPPDAEKLIENELKLIQEHGGRSDSPIFGFMLDYSQFIPRGHYTRTDRLRRYFQGMMWYGLVPFPFDSTYTQSIIQSILFTSILFHPQTTGLTLIKQWERLYQPAVFYVGSTDDLNPFHCKELMDEIYGSDLKLDEIPLKLDEFIKASEKLPEPGIKQMLIGIPTGKQFRFMGQRYIPDSEMLQTLSDYEHRPFPKGLDVMAVLGSKRAYDILLNVYQEEKSWPAYPDSMKSLKDRFSKLDLSTWQSNLYYGWLWSLQALLEEKKEGYPTFMTNPAWQDKVLNTTCASWAELRHDTILYGKQSGAECGGGEEPPPPPKGYVEPEVEFYSRLEWLTRFTKEGLISREIITPAVEQKFTYLGDLISFLKKVSIKELKEESLTREEHDQIKILGADIERLTLSVAEGHAEFLSETDKDMAVIADVHTSWDKCLEEGVGHANEIYVVVPIEGQLYLTRGAVFSYYEFIHPSSDRLTDEKWQEMLRSVTSPKPSVWTKSFNGGKKEPLPRPKKVYSSGC
jgi:hypothetical protein